MSLLTKSPWPRRFAAVLVTVLSLGAMTTLGAKPADARVFVGFSVGVPAWGWGYYPGYWGYYPGYWYRPYYPAYYGYGWGWRRWCYWYPYRCRW
jgi:hypothetical protein